MQKYRTPDAYLFHSGTLLFIKKIIFKKNIIQGIIKTYIYRWYKNARPRGRCVLSENGRGWFLSEVAAFLYLIEFSG